MAVVAIHAAVVFAGSGAYRVVAGVINAVVQAHLIAVGTAAIVAVVTDGAVVAPRQT